MIPDHPCKEVKSIEIPWNWNWFIFIINAMKIINVILCINDILCIIVFHCIMYHYVMSINSSKDTVTCQRSGHRIVSIAEVVQSKALPDSGAEDPMPGSSISYLNEHPQQKNWPQQSVMSFNQFRVFRLDPENNSHFSRNFFPKSKAQETLPDSRRDSRPSRHRRRSQRPSRREASNMHRIASM